MHAVVVRHTDKPLIARANVAFNKKRGTLRGTHFQCPPAAETKLVRCWRGAILDVRPALGPEVHDAAGQGSGTITSTPAGIACGGTCSGTFPAGTTNVTVHGPVPEQPPLQPANVEPASGAAVNVTVDPYG